MNLKRYRNIFILTSLILIIIASAPSLSLVAPFSIGKEPFSMLWVLGSEGMARDYPFNIAADKNYSVRVGVENQLGYCSYYLIYVKLRNQSEPLPNATAGKPSPLPPIYEHRIFLEDGRNWEASLIFSPSGVSFFNNQTLIRTFAVNDTVLNVDKLSSWSDEGKGYYYELFIELWTFVTETRNFQFHNRFVTVPLNMTF